MTVIKVTLVGMKEPTYVNGSSIISFNCSRAAKTPSTYIRLVTKEALVVIESPEEILRQIPEER